MKKNVQEVKDIYGTVNIIENKNKDNNKDNCQGYECHTHK